MNIRMEGVSLQNGRIPAIKMVRYLTNWGLKDSKDYVEAQPVYSGSFGGQMINLPFMPFRTDHPQIDNILAVEQMIKNETHMPSFLKIIDLSAPAADAQKRNRPTIASLKKDLADTRFVLESVNKAYDIAKSERQSIMNRIDEEVRHNVALVQQLNDLNRDTYDLRNDYNAAQDEINRLQGLLENSVKGPITIGVGTKTIVIENSGITFR